MTALLGIYTSLRARARTLGGYHLISSKYKNIVARIAACTPMRKIDSLCNVVYVKKHLLEENLYRAKVKVDCFFAVSIV